MALETYLVHNTALETMIFCYKMSPHWEYLACTSIINVSVLNNMEDEKQTVSFSLYFRNVDILEENKWNLPKIISMRSSFSPISTNTMNDSFLELVRTHRSPVRHFIWSCMELRTKATRANMAVHWKLLKGYYWSTLLFRKNKYCTRSFAIGF